MNYRILGKAIFKTFAWMIGGGVVLGLSAFGFTFLDNRAGGLLVLLVVCTALIICSIGDTYEKMLKKKEKEGGCGND